MIAKPLLCVDVSLAEAADNLIKAGQPEWLIESLVTMWTSVRAGQADQRTETFAELTGRAPQRFETWCREHRAAFV